MKNTAKTLTLTAKKAPAKSRAAGGAEDRDLLLPRRRSGRRRAAVPVAKVSVVKTVRAWLPARGRAGRDRSTAMRRPVDAAAGRRWRPTPPTTPSAPAAAHGHRAQARLQAGRAEAATPSRPTVRRRARRRSRCRAAAKAAKPRASPASRVEVGADRRSRPPASAVSTTTDAATLAAIDTSGYLLPRREGAGPPRPQAERIRARERRRSRR